MGLLAFLKKWIKGLSGGPTSLLSPEYLETLDPGLFLPPHFTPLRGFLTGFPTIPYYSLDLTVLRGAYTTTLTGTMKGEQVSTTPDGTVKWGVWRIISNPLELNSITSARLRKQLSRLI